MTATCACRWCSSAPAPDRDLIDDWDMASMDAYLHALARMGAHRAACKADRALATSGSHQDVVALLAAAETLAPPVDRPMHAARLDAYAAEHGLRGWWRTPTGRVQVNLLRTTADGDRGRYYALDGAVIDRDTGRLVADAPISAAAAEWIERAEGRWCPPVPPRPVVTVPLPSEVAA